MNALLDIDQKVNTGKWPAGLLCHASGTTDDGDLVVMEVWESRDAQGRFMQERLGPALQQGGITGAPTVTRVDLVSYNPAAGGRSPVSLIARYEPSASDEKYSMR